MADSRLISVVLPVFNERLDRMKASVESILNQTHSNLELLIVDDSTDREIIEYLSTLPAIDGRVSYVRNRERKGLARSLNIGIGVAKGCYIARAD